MFGILRARLERCKALLASSAAVDLECDVLSHFIAREAEFDERRLEFPPVLPQLKMLPSCGP